MAVDRQQIDPSEVAPHKKTVKTSSVAHDAANGCSFGLLANVVLWFGSSIIFNITASMLLRHLPDAEDMTVLELTVVVLSGILTLPPRGLRLLPGGAAALPGSLAMGGFHLCNCRSFVYCLQFIPTSLAQTIRATNPVWVVAITGVLGQRYGLPTMCSLIPLVGGFALAVGAEPNGFTRPQGVLAALVSANAQVAVNLLGKRRLAQAQDCAEKTKPPHAFELQFASSLFALVTLLPIWLLGGGLARLGGHIASATDEVRNRILFLAATDGVLYFIEQSASFAALQSFRPLSFAVIDTLRRLCIVIVAGFWMQGTALTVSRLLGVLLVLTGGLWFALVCLRARPGGPMLT